MKRNLIPRLLIGWLLVAAAALIACAPQSAPTPTPMAAPVATLAPATTSAVSPPKTALEQEWQGIVAAARREGTVNLYSTFGTPELRNVLDKAMRENYGIKIE